MLSKKGQSTTVEGSALARGSGAGKMFSNQQQIMSVRVKRMGIFKFAVTTTTNHVTSKRHA
jgi:hypothetical protein